MLWQRWREARNSEVKFENRNQLFFLFFFRPKGKIGFLDLHFVPQRSIRGTLVLISLFTSTSCFTSCIFDLLCLGSVRNTVDDPLSPLSPRGPRHPAAEA